MDSVGQIVENEINDACRYPFKFHGVNKVVIKLDQPPVDTPDYVELAGVGKKQIPQFNLQFYLAMTELQRRKELIATAKSVFKWLIENFEDADFARLAAERLDWDLNK